MRRVLLWTNIVVAAFLAPWARIAWGEAEELAGRPIVEIRIEAPPTADLARIRAAIRTREGDAYDEESVRRDLRALLALGDIAPTTRVEPEATDGGVRLIFRVDLRPRVARIRLESGGPLPVSESKIKERLGVREGSFADPYRLKVDLQSLRSLLREEGYAFAEVSQDVRPIEEGVEVVYRIAAGHRVKLREVRFEGNQDIPERDLRAVMVSVERDWLFGARRFDPALIERDLDAIRETVRRRGFLDATVEHELRYDEDRRGARLIVRIRQGPLYRISRILVKGAQTIPTPEILGAMSLHEGDPFSRDALDRDIEAIRSLYGRRGYIRARIEPVPTVDETRPEVSLVLEIEENLLYHVRNVVIRGNRITKDHVIRRDVALAPGDVADASGLDDTVRRLRRTGLFAPSPESGKEAVRAEFLDTEEPGLADLLVEVVEGERGTVSVGLGWNSDLGAVGNLTLHLNNFDALDLPTGWRDFISGGAWLGGGQELTLSLSPGSEYSEYQFTWTEPRLMDSDYSLSLSAYLRNFFWEDHYHEARTGGSVTVGRRFGEYWRAALTGRVERVHVGHLSDNAPGDAVSARGGHWLHTLELSLAHDTRDDIFLTTSGHRVEGAVEMAGTILGGDVDYLRETIEARQWWTVFTQKNGLKHVVSVGGEVGLMQTTSSDSVPIFQRFFMGGLATPRGFEYRGAGPADPVFGEQIGGEYLALLGAEYEAPLYRDIVRGVVFVDTGALERSLADFGGDSVRLTTGVGLRIRLPAMGGVRVPITVYLAVPILDQPEDETQPFNVSIGTGFSF